MTCEFVCQFWIAHRLLTTPTSIKALAKELHVAPERIRAAFWAWTTPQQRAAAFKRKMSAVRAGRSLKGTPRFDWSQVDWHWTNNMIARQLGCCAQSVAIARARYGKRDPSAYHRPERTLRALGLRPSSRARREKQIAERLLTTSATCESIADELGVSPVTVWNIYCRHTTKEQRQERRRQKIGASNRISKTIQHRIDAERAESLERLRNRKTPRRAA
jgi:hypothetical protein